MYGVERDKILVVYCGSCQKTHKHPHNFIAYNFTCPFCGYKNNPKFSKKVDFNRLLCTRGVLYANERSLAGQTMLNFNKHQNIILQNIKPTLHQKIMFKLKAISL